MHADHDPPRAPTASPAPWPGRSRQIDSAVLLGPQGEVFIRHGDQLYRLRVTSQGKLILTK